MSNEEVVPGAEKAAAVVANDVASTQPTQSPTAMGATEKIEEKSANQESNAKIVAEAAASPSSADAAHLQAKGNTNEEARVEPKVEDSPSKEGQVITNVASDMASKQFANDKLAIADVAAEKSEPPEVQTPEKAQESKEVNSKKQIQSNTPKESLLPAQGEPSDQKLCPTPSHPPNAEPTSIHSSSEDGSPQSDELPVQQNESPIQKVARKPSDLSRSDSFPEMIDNEKKALSPFAARRPIPKQKIPEVRRVESPIAKESDEAITISSESESCFEKAEETLSKSEESPFKKMAVKGAPPLLPVDEEDFQESNDDYRPPHWVFPIPRLHRPSDDELISHLKQIFDPTKQ